MGLVLGPVARFKGRNFGLLDFCAAGSGGGLGPRNGRDGDVGSVVARGGVCEAVRCWAVGSRGWGGGGGGGGGEAQGDNKVSEGAGLWERRSVSFFGLSCLPHGCVGDGGGGEVAAGEVLALVCQDPEFAQAHFGRTAWFKAAAKLIARCSTSAARLMVRMMAVQIQAIILTSLIRLQSRVDWELIATPETVRLVRRVRSDCDPFSPACLGVTVVFASRVEVVRGDCGILGRQGVRWGVICRVAKTVEAQKIKTLRCV